MRADQRGLDVGELLLRDAVAEPARHFAVHGGETLGQLLRRERSPHVELTVRAVGE